MIELPKLDEHVIQGILHELDFCIEEFAGRDVRYLEEVRSAIVALPIMLQAFKELKHSQEMYRVPGNDKHRELLLQANIVDYAIQHITRPRVVNDNG